MKFILTLAFFLPFMSLNVKSINAQITPDSTLGHENSVVRPNTEINGKLVDLIEGGATRGNNLFHSFLEFNLSEGQAAYFVNPTVIQNIFSRVTGGNPSHLFGTLGVLGNANLFFINPNGIIFGPNASLDIRGSFVGTTAEELIFPDGHKFSANNPEAIPLLTINVQPTIGLQFGEDSGSIINAGDLNSGGNISLVGNSVVNRGNISAPEIEMIGIGSGDVLVEIGTSGEVLNITNPTANIPSGSSENPLEPENVVAQKSEVLRPNSKNNATHQSAHQSSGANSEENGIRGETLQLSGSELLSLGLGVNELGEVILNDSGLVIEAGDVVISPLDGGIGLQGERGLLNAANNLQLINTQVGVRGDLSLYAGNRVLMRDSVESPLLAVSGRDLLIQGDQIDIFALNHPYSGLVSGGDMIFRSPNPVIGDAHYWSGGHFQIEQLDGSLGNLNSIEDPIIRAAGDVSFNLYQGTSLHIIAGGSVNAGTIIITDVETGTPGIDFLQEAITLTDGTVVNLDGSQQAIVDIRAGVKPEAIGIPGLTGFDFATDLFAELPPSTSEPATSANIIIGDIAIIPENGTVLITNQYEPNLTLSGGNIRILSSEGIVPDIDTNPTAEIDSVAIDARANVNIDGRILASSSSNRGGDIIINSQGDISLTNGVIDVTGNEGGSININAKNINAIDSQIIGGIGAGLGFDGANSGDVIINASESIGIENSSISNDVRLNAIGNSGKVIINAQEIAIEDGAIISASTAGEGNAGVIEITANDSVTLSGESSQGDRSLIASKVEETGVGDSGGIAIKTFSTFTLSDGAIIDADTLGEGNAGKIEISATDSVSISAIFEESVSDRLIIRSRVKETGVGDSGGIVIDTSNLALSEGAEIIASILGKGNAGAIQITATDSVSLSRRAGIDSGIGPGGLGDSGGIVINTSTLTLSGGARIFSANSFGEGNAGAITIWADSVSLSGETGNTSFISSTSTGDSPEIVIDTSILTLDFAVIASSNFGEKNAGTIQITASTLNLSGGSLIDASNFTSEEGNGGPIQITASTLNLSEGAQINAGTLGKGNGGDIHIIARDSVSLSGTAFNQEFDRDLGGVSAFTLSTGKAGDITIDTPQLTISEGAEIKVFTIDEGNAGNITINVSESLTINGGSVSSNTTGRGNTGEVRINATESIILNSINGENPGLIENTVGEGFTLLITLTDQSVLQFEIADNPQATGNGSRVFIDTQTLSLTKGANITTSTLAFGNTGQIEINATEIVSVDGEFSDGVSSLISSNIAENAQGNLSSGNFYQPSISFPKGAAVY